LPAIFTGGLRGLLVAVVMGLLRDVNGSFCDPCRWLLLIKVKSAGANRGWPGVDVNRW